MAPDPHRRRRVTPAATATMLLIGLGAGAPAAANAAQPSGRPAAAAPSPAPAPTSEQGLRKSLDALNEEAEILTEKYNKTRVELGKAQKEERAAAQQAATLRAAAEPARARLGQLAAANYMSGSPNAIFGTGGSPDGLSDSAYLAQNQATAIRALQKQIDQAETAQRTAQTKITQVRKAAADAEQARKAAKTKVAEVMKRLDKLTTTHVRDPRSGLRATVKGSGLPAKMARKALTKLGSPTSGPPPDRTASTAPASSSGRTPRSASPGCRTTPATCTAWEPRSPAANSAPATWSTSARASTTWASTSTAANTCTPPRPAMW